MLNAAVKQCEVFGGKLVSFDEGKIAKMPGVRRALKVDDVTVAVVADTWWHAKKALDALPIVWDEGPNAKVTSAQIAEHLKTGLTSSDAFADTNVGDTLKAIAAAPKKVEAVYSTPFLSHATLEPMNCTAKVTADRAEAWVPTQNAEQALAALSENSGIPLAQCEVYRMDPGGGFGRRVTIPDYVRMSTQIAKEFPGVPVKMIWSREEDQMHGFYRPISQCRLQAGIDESGNLQALPHPCVRPVDQRVFESRRRSRTARTCASSRGCGRSPATRSSATPCPISRSSTRCATRTCRSGRGAA